MQSDDKTRGELLLEGLATVKAGLELIGRAGKGKADMVHLLATSATGAKQLRELLRGPSLLHQVVLGMVKARNGRLADDTVEKVVSDFLTVLQDLAQPVEPPEGSEAGATEKP